MTESSRVSGLRRFASIVDHHQLGPESDGPALAMILMIDQSAAADDAEAVVSAVGKHWPCSGDALRWVATDWEKQDGGS